MLDVSEKQQHGNKKRRTQNPLDLIIMDIFISGSSVSVSRSVCLCLHLHNPFNLRHVERHCWLVVLGLSPKGNSCEKKVLGSSGEDGVHRHRHRATADEDHYYDDDGD